MPKLAGTECVNDGDLGCTLIWSRVGPRVMFAAQDREPIYPRQQSYSDRRRSDIDLTSVMSY